MPKINNSIMKNNLSIFTPKNIVMNITEGLKTLISPEDEQYKIKQIETKLGEPHPFDYTIIDGLMKKFGLVNAVIDKTVDFAVGPKLTIDCKDKRGKQILDDFIEGTELRKYIKPWVKEGLGKGTGYMEIAGLDGDDKEIEIKVVSSNSMYKRRDKFGIITGYVQYIGNNLSRINSQDAIELKPEEIIDIDFNKVGNSAYGMGMIHSAIQTIDDFLMAQKAIHKLTKRKANMPIWVKLGNAEKDDYPQQAQIDAFGEKLQFMDEVTEWVTGPNVDIKTVDTGNIGQKFDGVLANDYKLLSYCFQIPETILGAGNVPEGLARVQMDTFDRRIKSLQDEIGLVIKKLLKRVLHKNGVDVLFHIVWGELNEEDRDKMIIQYNSIISNMSISPGLRLEVEKKLAVMLEINYDEVQAENDARADKDVENPEREREEDEPLPEVPGQKSLESIQIKEDVYEDTGNLTVEEWISFNYNDLRSNIVQAIQADKFTALRASNSIERSAGYLSAAKVNQLRQIFTEGFMLNHSVKEIETKVQRVAGPLYKYNEKGLILDNGEKIIRLDSSTRANMIARTETVRLANIGNLDFYKTKNVQNVRFVASLSERTCELCTSLNGTIYDINESYGIIPEGTHMNCRCAMVPVILENVQPIIK